MLVNKVLPPASFSPAGVFRLCGSSFNAKCVSQETLPFPAIDYFKKIDAYLYRYLPIHYEGIY